MIRTTRHSHAWALMGIDEAPLEFKKMEQRNSLRVKRFLTMPPMLAMVVVGACLLITTVSWAQDDAPPPPPIREPLPPKVTDPEAQLEPQVVIRREEGRTVEEYVSNGRVYMVKITPVVGPSYYLIDSTGDGLLDLEHDRFEPVKPVYWKIFEW
ncbi:MAG: DUF2782 domain-containing protein [Xanthomonadaceae bacterium]|nr:DUF2782 domain-containing protein [Xanthomonadaceae bacterium]